MNSTRFFLHKYFPIINLTHPFILLKMQQNLLYLVTGKGGCVNTRTVCIELAFREIDSLELHYIRFGWLNIFGSKVVANNAVGSCICGLKASF